MPGDREPTQTIHATRPFVRVLRERPEVPAEVLSALAARESGERIEVARMQQLLAAAVALTSDPDLGLRAARACEVGDFGLVEYICTSASTWREGIEALIRYRKILDAAAEAQLTLTDGRASLEFGSSVPLLVRAGVEFQVAAFFVVIDRWLRPAPPGGEVHFRHAAPVQLEQHALTFGTTPVRFDAEFDGLSWDAGCLDTPLRTAEAGVHGLLRTRADVLLAEMSASDGDWLARVRADILKGLPHGESSAARTAGRLGISRSTLTRRLRDEGTTFSAQMEDLRTRMANDYLRETDHSIEEIAFLVGFSESPAFVRAFKRWHGTTPFEWRAQRAGQA